VIGVEEKVEDKEVTIHLLPHCWFVRLECLRSHSLMYFENFEMKIRVVVYYGVLFSKSSYLIDLKLSFKSCVSLSRGRSVAFYTKEPEKEQRLSSIVKNGKILFCNEILRECGKLC